MSKKSHIIDIKFESESLINYCTYIIEKIVILTNIKLSVTCNLQQLKKILVGTYYTSIKYTSAFHISFKLKKYLSLGKS